MSILTISDAIYLIVSGALKKAYADGNTCQPGAKIRTCLTPGWMKKIGVLLPVVWRGTTGSYEAGFAGRVEVEDR
jgi:hypothetical protein